MRIFAATNSGELSDMEQRNQLLRRPRRNRKSEVIRSMVAESVIMPQHLIAPLFVIDGKNLKVPVKSMPGVDRFSIDQLLFEAETLLNLGIKSIALFPAIADNLKTQDAQESWNMEGLYLRAIKTLKREFPELMIMSDVAMDPYSSDGHDGMVRNGEILNDETLPILSKMALAQAEAGADIIGPSDMMDGRVGWLRSALDSQGFEKISIMSYAAKYASAFYGPFRDALDSSPKFGDKKTYQMNPANAKEALLEARLDYSEGADFLMVKPGLPYLDIVKLLADEFDIPIAAYNVSGEYAMVKAAASNGWVDGEKVMLESLLSFRRAGASVILTYFAKEFGSWYKANNAK